MKSWKKKNYSKCSAKRIVKEKPCTNPCNKTEKNDGGKNVKVPERDVKTIVKKSNVGSKKTEETTIKCIKCDCGGNATSESDSNALAKSGQNSPSEEESQFMQQQNQICVFSTMLANEGADAIIRGQFPSLVAFHHGQLGLRRFQEKYANKENKGWQGPEEWLNDFNDTGQIYQQPQCSNSFTRQTPESPVSDLDSPQFWNEQPTSRNGNGEKSVGNTESSVNDTINKVGNSRITSHCCLRGTTSSRPSSLQLSLQGVKVPDEILTSDQRQHREERLAAIRKMQVLLFSDRKDGPDGSLVTTQGTQSQSFGSDGVHTSAVSPLDNFSADVDWEKLQDQLIEPTNKVEPDNYTVPSSGRNIPQVSRSQSPPLPYHQPSRPASVPALQSSNPSSPNDPTSTLSLPSPRASSALNSPKDPGKQFHHGDQRPEYLPAVRSRMTPDFLCSEMGRILDGVENHLNHSNPGTPVSSPHLISFSPGGSTPQKDSIDIASSQSPSVDDILCEALQSVNGEPRDQVASAIGTEEAILMPVLSPQQIPYLNTFESHELMIQKQSDTNLKGNNSPSNTPCSIATSTIGMLSESGGTSPSTENTDRSFMGPLDSPKTPCTPSSNTAFDLSTVNTGNKVTSGQNSPATSYRQNLPNGMGRPRTVPKSPKLKDVSPPSNRKQHELIPGHSNDPRISLQSNGKKFSCSRLLMNMKGQPENVPLNPNNIISMQEIQGTSNTNSDPITSLAQMSRQLANIVPRNSQGDGPIIYSGISQAMNLMKEKTSLKKCRDVGGFAANLGKCLSKSYNPRPSRPQTSYRPMHPSVYYGEPRDPQRLIDWHNSMRTNVQVKPGAPNTIQYLPTANPNYCQRGPRPPPSVAFLQRFTNTSNQRFVNNMGINQGPIHNIQQNVIFSRMNRPQRPNGFQTGQNYNQNHQMRPQIVRMHQGPSAVHMHHMIGGRMFQGIRMNSNESFGGAMMPQITNQSTPRMYMSGNRGNITGMRFRAPVQSGMGTNMDGSGNNFKNGPFMRATGMPGTNLNYAQQYQNFQQQLYATGTRPGVSQHGNIHMGTNSPPLLPER